MDKILFRKADELLHVAFFYLYCTRRSFDVEDYNIAVSRAYRCVFEAMKCVLLLDGKECSSPEETMGAFRKAYIETGIFNVILSDNISITFDSKEQFGCDDDDNQCPEELALVCLKSAEYFYNVVEDYVKKNYFSQGSFYD